MKRLDGAPKSIEPDWVWADAYRRAVESHSIVSITNRRGVIIYANDRFVEISGYSRDELVGADHSILNSGHHDAFFFKRLWQTIASGKNWTGEICNRAKDGSHYWVHTDIVPLSGTDETIDGYISVRRDITARKRTERELRRSEAFLRHVADVSGVGGWALDLQRQELYWSKHTKLIHEVEPDYKPELATAIDFYAPEARAAINHAVETAIDTGESWDLELPLITAKGNQIWVRAVGQPLIESGQTVSLIGAFQNITDRKVAEDVLRDEVASRHSAEQLLRDVLETIPDAVAAYDKEDRLIVCNSGYLETYAASRDAIRPGATFESILRHGLARGQYADVGADPEAQEAWLRDRLAQHREPPDQVVQRLRDGTWLQIREHKSGTGATVGVRTDVTSIKRAETQLRRYAEEDRLTQLMNRARFSADLDALLMRGLEPDTSQYSCLALFDIDHFKPINDAYGHDAGDEVLKAVGSRVRTILGPQDFAARLGGDEFVFVLQGYPSQAVCEARVAALFAAMEEPIAAGPTTVSVTLSLGLTKLRGMGQTTRMALKEADRAQYRAKEGGRAHWRWYEEADRLAEERDERLRRQLGSALTARDGVTFALQPIRSTADGGMIGFSGEMAWRHDGTDLDTRALLALGARANLTGDLCTRKLDVLLGQIGAHQARGIACGLIWLTMSAEQLRLGKLASKLLARASANHIDVSKLIIAVEESAFLERSSSAVESALKTIGDAGMALGIDGFGSAGVSLGVLKQLGVRAVRISPSRLANGLSGSDESGAAHRQVVAAAVAAAQAMDIAVFCADLSTCEEADMVSALGVTGLQGPCHRPTTCRSRPNRVSQPRSCRQARQHGAGDA
ncbi:MAG: diguanylate cyclase [Devosiaceae bacterium]|nr:diguanylate cyclase [Devosiaceae bacterium MH13]